MLLKDDYGTFLQTNKNVSHNTMLSYIRDINKFGEYLNTVKIDSTSVMKVDIEEYLHHMQKSGQAPASMQRMIASLRSYYGFIIERGLMNYDPTAGLKSPKAERHELEILTPKETELFLKQPECINFKGYRDKAMLELIYATGIKVSELINLTIDDIDLAESVVFCGSGKKKRIIPFGAMAKVSLKNYIERARFSENFEEESNVLFINIKGGKMSRQGFWTIIKYYKDKAKITKEINSNTLRHSFAVHLMENGADVSSVREMLGHTAINSIKPYAQAANKRLRDVYKRTHPRA